MSKTIGKAYVGRIKDPKHNVNLHSKHDLLHAIIYEDTKESFDFIDLKKLVEEDNGLIFYSTHVNKDKKPSTWEKCKDALKNKPPVGSVCVLEHERPLSFGQFAELAYSKAILSNSLAYEGLKDRLSASSDPFPKPIGPSCYRSGEDKSAFDAVRRGIKTAEDLKVTMGNSILPSMSASMKQLTQPTPEVESVGSNVVIGKGAKEFDELSREHWQERALNAESENNELKGKIATMSDEILELRAALSNSDKTKEGFAANADLAQVAVRETQALASKTIIEGLKPQLSAIPKIASNVEALNAKIDALMNLPDMVKALMNLPNMMGSLADLPAKMVALKASVEESRIHGVETDYVSEAETILCSQTRMFNVLAQFGFAKENTPLDVPAILHSIWSKEGPSSPPSGTPSCSSGGSGVSWSAQDTSRPPPSLPSSNTRPSTYQLEHRNNNSVPGGLLRSPVPPVDLLSRQDPYGYSVTPSYSHGYPHPPAPGQRHTSGGGLIGGPGGSEFGYGPGPSHGYHRHGPAPPPPQGGGYHNKRSYPFTDSQGNMKK